MACFISEADVLINKLPRNQLRKNRVWPLYVIADEVVLKRVNWFKMEIVSFTPATYLLFEKTLVLVSRDIQISGIPSLNAMQKSFKDTSSTEKQQLCNLRLNVTFRKLLNTSKPKATS